MASPKPNKRTALAAYLAERRPERIGEAEWAELRSRLAPVSVSYLRRLIRACGAPLAPVVEGVRQDSLAELERTLLALAEEYESGDRERRAACRRAVIEAKDHARFALRRPGVSSVSPEQRHEMLLWMLTWLENPAAFPVWLRLRKPGRI